MTRWWKWAVAVIVFTAVTIGATALFDDARSARIAAGDSDEISVDSIYDDRIEGQYDPDYDPARYRSIAASFAADQIHIDGCQAFDVDDADLAAIRDGRGQGGSPSPRGPSCHRHRRQRLGSGPQLRPRAHDRRDRGPRRRLFAHARPRRRTDRRQRRMRRRSPCPELSDRQRGRRRDLRHHRRKRTGHRRRIRPAGVDEEEAETSIDAQQVAEALPTDPFYVEDSLAGSLNSGLLEKAEAKAAEVDFDVYVIAVDEQSIDRDVLEQLKVFHGERAPSS